eukprot:4565904-Amphidinium_carterae.1
MQIHRVDQEAPSPRKHPMFPRQQRTGWIKWLSIQHGVLTTYVVCHLSEHVGTAHGIEGNPGHLILFGAC